jgi:hypothetical protein
MVSYNATGPVLSFLQQRLRRRPPGCLLRLVL